MLVEQPSDRSEMDISAEDGHSDSIADCELLELEDQPVSLFLVCLGGPVIVQIVEQFGVVVELLAIA